MSTIWQRTRERFMKSEPLEPGLVPLLRLLVLALLVGEVAPRLLGPFFDLRLPASPYQLLVLPGYIVLVAYAFWPTPAHKGHLFLLVGLGLATGQLLLVRWLTIYWLAPPELRPLLALIWMVRVWLLMLQSVLIIAWQYEWPAVLLVVLLLSFVDGTAGALDLIEDDSLFVLAIVIWLVRLVSMLLVGLAVVWLMGRQRAQRAALAAANRQLRRYAVAQEQLAVSQERNRLARELHDTLAHSLSGVSVQLEAVTALWEIDPAAAQRMLAQALQSTRRGLGEARGALQALRASPLADLGLLLALSHLAEAMAERGALTLELRLPARVDHLPPEVEHCVYRISQEALSNVVRHAQASQVRVELRCRPSELALTISDDGQGFDAAHSPPGHFGVAGMRERAALVGGTLTIESAPGQGTTLRLHLSGWESNGQVKE